jgi:hypothetical protein
MVPVRVVHVGCTVALAVGVAIVGTALTVRFVPLDTHPVGVFLTVTV